MTGSLNGSRRTPNSVGQSPDLTDAGRPGLAQTAREEPRSEIDPSLTVAVGIWVTLSYTAFDSTGQPLEDVARNMTYLHGGYGEVLPKIETALLGKSMGDQCSMYLEPDDAFGDYDADLVSLVPIERLPENIEIGMTFEGIPGEAPDGRVYAVTDVAQGQAVVDGNHPLAGIAVRYELTVEELRTASEEDIAREEQAREDADL